MSISSLYDADTSPSFTLQLSDGSELIWKPYVSRLETVDGQRVPLSRIGHTYHDNQIFDEAFVISPDNPGRKFSNIKRIKIQLGLSCNYSCKYCLQSAERTITRCTRSLLEIENFVLKLKSAITDHAPDGADLIFEFWGGEPFLYWDTLKPLAESIRSVYKKANFIIITNGSLFTEERVDWLIDQNFQIGISHDGPGQHLRGPDPLDSPESLRLIKKLYTALAHKGQLAFSVVLTLNNYSFNDIINYLKEKLDTDDVDIVTEGFPLVLDDTSRHLSQTVSDDIYQNIRHAMRDELKNDDVVLQNKKMHMYLTNFYSFLITNKPALTSNLFCPATYLNVISIDLDGNILTCHNFNIDHDHKAGHIDDIDNVRVRNLLHWAHRPECRTCPVVLTCSGACPVIGDPGIRKLTCDNHFLFHAIIFAIAIYNITGHELVSIEGDQIRYPEISKFDY